MNLFDAFNIRRTTKKLSTNDLKEMIEKELKSILSEEADPSKFEFERFPLKLSQSLKKSDTASELVTKGHEDGSDSDDVVDAKPAGKSVKDLKPSQSSMDIDKAVAFAIAALLKNEPFPKGAGGDLGAIITSDSHIMDGHHRWIATGMIDPTASVGGYIVEFPAKEMIAALNMITVSLGVTTGKSGTGGFGQFNEAGIKKVLEKFAAEGVWSADDSAENVVKALEDWTGMSGADEAISAAAKKMGENVSQLTLSVPSGFPERHDMPVISAKAGHLEKAIALLRAGKVDLNPPYAEETTTSESRDPVTGKQLILDRWSRIAGIIND
jgi:hypothetical protein